jgi:predicted AlkP superfamily pyrophosphatase or phosphodiesterase
MKEKVILISIDGMRPDGLKQCGNPCVEQIEKMAYYTYNGRSVMPSVTLPCHYSMSHSVEPMRHGILTNIYVPEVRPVPGIFERIKESGGKSAAFIGWEPMRDIARPGSLRWSTYINAFENEETDTVLTDAAIERIECSKPDFVYLYMVDTDEKGGHGSGWMSEEYLRRISIAIGNAKRVIDRFADEYSIIIMADHGGHDRSHGTEMPEDITIPFFYIGMRFPKGAEMERGTLLDIAPTIADLMGVLPADEWEGESKANKEL